MGIQIESWQFRDDLSIDEMKELMALRDPEKIKEHPAETYDKLVKFFNELREEGPTINGKTSAKTFLKTIKTYLDNFLASIDL